MNKQDEIEIDLVKLFTLLKKKMVYIILALVAGMLLSGIVTKFFITPIYTSNTKLYILSKTTDITQLTDLQIGTQLTQDYTVLINTRPVIYQVIENLKLEYDYETMLDKITITNPENSRVLKIAVKDPDPELAQNMAEELTEVTVQRISDKMDMEAPKIIEEANLPVEADSPSLKKNVVIGGGLGMILAIGIIVLMYLVNDTIRTREDIEQYLGLTILATVPKEDPRQHTIKKSVKKMMRGGSSS